MIDVPAAVTTSGIFASVARGATASAAGVTPNPARNCTLSLTISSCARRLELSGTAPSSLMMTWTFFPATMSPCCCWNSLIAAEICLPVDCCWPVMGRMKPILTVSCAATGAAKSASAATAIKRLNMPGSLL